MPLAGCRLRPELESIRELVLELDSELLELAEENMLQAG
jgi:chorismate mutase